MLRQELRFLGRAISRRKKLNRIPLHGVVDGHYRQVVLERLSDQDAVESTLAVGLLVSAKRDVPTNIAK